MTPEQAETRLRVDHGFRIETGCIREACEFNWLRHTITPKGEIDVSLEDVVAKWIKPTN